MYTDETLGQQVNSFWDVSLKLDGEDEDEEVEEIHMSRNEYNNRSKSKVSSSYSPSISEPTKTVSTNKKYNSNGKESSSSPALSNLDYYFLEDFKNNIANVSLFELIKVSQI